LNQLPGFQSISMLVVFSTRVAGSDLFTASAKFLVGGITTGLGGSGCFFMDKLAAITNKMAKGSNTKINIKVNNRIALSNVVASSVPYTSCATYLMGPTSLPACVAPRSILISVFVIVEFSCCFL